MTITGQSWYSSWFDTPYYHILYRDRGYEEAEGFMINLMSFLNLKQGASVLDLACGKGRHSIFLNKLGFNVTGVDLSKHSITFAKKFENEKLHFQVHDMCQPMDKKFDAVLNLFTSFGYFDREQDNLATIRAIKQEIKQNGYGVIDFMNVEKVLKNLVSAEEKEVRGVTFRLRRFYRDGFILKNIQFEDEGETFNYTEKVKALTLLDFKAYFKKAEINLLHTFGSYDFEEFKKDTSDRLILIFN